MDSKLYWTRFSHRFRKDFWLFKNYETAIYVSSKEQNQKTYQFLFKALHHYPDKSKKSKQMELTKKILQHTTSPIADYIGTMPYKLDILTQLTEIFHDDKLMKSLFQRKFSISVGGDSPRRKLLLISLNRDGNCQKVLEFLQKEHSKNPQFVRKVLLDSTTKKSTFLHAFVEENKSEKSEKADQLLKILKALEKVCENDKRTLEQLIAKKNRDGKTVLELVNGKFQSNEELKKWFAGKNLIAGKNYDDIEMRTIK
jgi:hypothetical protein